MMPDDGGGIDTRQLDVAIAEFRDLVERVGDFKQELNRFFYAWAGRAQKAWDQVKMGGGTYRGIVWKGVAKSYKRRPSGAKVTRSQTLLMDTGNLRNAMLLKPVSVDRFELVVGVRGDPLKYAEPQNKRRSFAHWQMGVDDVVLRKIVLEKINRWCRDHGWRNPDR